MPCAGGLDHGEGVAGGGGGGEVLEGGDGEVGEVVGYALEMANTVSDRLEVSKNKSPESGHVEENKEHKAQEANLLLIGRGRRCPRI